MDDRAVHTMAEEIQLRIALYALCGIDDHAEVLQTGEEMEVLLMICRCRMSTVL